MVLLLCLVLVTLQNDLVISKKTLTDSVFVHVLVEYSYVLEGLTCPIDPPSSPPPYQLFLLYWIPFLYWISGGGAGYE
jgi:hypothetical protein